MNKPSLLERLRALLNPRRTPTRAPAKLPDVGRLTMPYADYWSLQQTQYRIEDREHAANTADWVANHDGAKTIRAEIVELRAEADQLAQKYGLRDYAHWVRHAEERHDTRVLPPGLEMAEAIAAHPVDVLTLGITGHDEMAHLARGMAADVLVKQLDEMHRAGQPVVQEPLGVRLVAEHRGDLTEVLDDPRFAQEYVAHTGTTMLEREVAAIRAKLVVDGAIAERGPSMARTAAPLIDQLRADVAARPPASPLLRQGHDHPLDQAR